MDNRYIVVFDGVCNFCNSAVNFIIKRDPEGIFVFAPMQTELAKQLMQKHEIYNADIDTFLLIKNDQCFVFSTAALEITKDLTGLWYLFNLFRVIPSSVRDTIYKLFGRNRYRLFGRKEACIIPTEEVKSRFIGLDGLTK